jgi:hypothetical protein
MYSKDSTHQGVTDSCLTCFYKFWAYRTQCDLLFLAAYYIKTVVAKIDLQLRLIESIKWLIEDQAFSPEDGGVGEPKHTTARKPGPLSVIQGSGGRMVWLLPRPLPPSPVSKLDRQHTARLRKRDNLLTGEGMGEEPKHTSARKPGSL